MFLFFTKVKVAKKVRNGDYVQKMLEAIIGNVQGAAYAGRNQLLGTD